MENLDDIYAQIMSSAELKARLVSAKSSEGLAALVRELGGDASAEEIAAFFKKRSSGIRELADEELAQIVGG